MAGRSSYDEKDRAFVYVTLASNDGNVKRTSRDTGIPEQTVRRWKSEFETEPPDTSIIAQEVDKQVGDMERVEGLALKELERKIRAQEMKGSELIAAFGVLNDKRTRAQGLATSRTEHRVALPSREEIAALLGGAVATAIQAAGTREAEIVDAEIVETKELPSGSFITEHHE